MKVMLVSRDLRHKGGVVNFARLLLKNRKHIDGEIIHFVEGRPPEKKTLALPFTIIKQYSDFKKMLEKENVDMVHLNPSIGRVPMWRDGMYLRIAKKRGVKVLFFIRGWDDLYFESAVKNGPFKWFHRKSFQMADRIIVLSKDFRDKLIKLGINGDKIDVLTTMVEHDRFKPENKSFRPVFKLLFCGNVVREKGVFEMMEALRYVVKEIPEIKLTVLGTGRDFKELVDFTRKLGVSRYVDFKGYVDGDEKYRIFKESHIFVFPSYSEGFPNVVLEAMASGQVVITTMVGGLKYEFKDGKNGFFIESNPPKPEEIAEKILFTLKDRKKMEEISRYNMHEAATKYDVRAVIKKLNDIYHSMYEQV